MPEPTRRALAALGPLARPVFRAIWLAALASNIGTLMQGVASALLMTSLTTSPVPVALLTTMANLPLLLVGLHAGALADLIDRRWLVLVTQVWMLAVAALLGALTALGLTTPTLLLMLTFLIGLGGALSAPAWQAIMPQLVPRRELATANDELGAANAEPSAAARRARANVGSDLPVRTEREPDHLLPRRRPPGEDAAPFAYVSV